RRCGLGLLLRREPVRRRLRERQQLPRQILRVLDDPLTLGPDPVDLGVEVLDPLPGAAGDLRRLLPRPLEPVLRLAARLRRDLGGSLVRPLEDRRDLLADALERPPDGGLR